MTVRFLVLNSVVKLVSINLKEITCPELTPPRHGSFSCSDEERYESVCEFVCESEFILVGESTTTCGASGIFSPIEVACVPLTVAGES